MIVTAIFINCGTLLSCACFTQSNMTFCFLFIGLHPYLSELLFEVVGL